MSVDQLLDRPIVRYRSINVGPMRYEHLPDVDVRYWSLITLASIFGCNAGDVISFYVHWNHWIGLAPLAVVFAALLFGERRSARATDAWYWAVVIVLRMAATNLADLATHTFEWPYPAVILGLAVFQAVVVVPVLPRLLATGSALNGKPAANGWYWTSLLTAGTLGTAVGDCVAEQLHLGTGVGTVLLGTVFAVVLAVGSGSSWTTKAGYWLAILAARAAGTTAGDWLAFRDDPGLRNGLHLGLPISTALTCAVFLGTFFIWRNRKEEIHEYNPANPAHVLVSVRRRFPSKGKTVLWSIMALAGISVLFSTELPILRDQSGPNHLFRLTLIADRYLFIPHAVGGILATLIGPVQFSTRLRRNHLRLHRVLGRVYAYAVLAAALLAIVIDWHRPLFAGNTVQATAWIVCTLLAVLTARNRHVVQHRQWAIRSYAMTFTFIALRVLNFWPAYANMSDTTFNIVDIILTFLAVSIPTIAYDWRTIVAKRT